MVRILQAISVFFLILLFSSLGHAEIIDNTDVGFSTVGSWGASSSVSGFYGSNYLWTSSGSGTNQASWSFSVADGQYELSAQWAAFDNRASNATYSVRNNGIEIGTQVFDQRVNGGQFNAFDTGYTVSAGTLEVVLTNNADGIVIADAMQLVFLGSGGNIAPNGVIDTPSSGVTINIGDSVDFTGTGSDPDNNLPLSYLWDFGDPAIADALVEDPGLIQFNNVGSFTVTFTVTDDLGLADPTPATVNVNVQNPSSGPTIIDNTDAGFSTVGSWGASSSVPGFYGSDYRYINNSVGANTATWAATLPEGKYDIFAQWTEHANRATNAKYTIFDNGTDIRSYWANQRIDGGQFNFLGSFYLQNGNQEVVLFELPTMNGYIVADAIKFENICQADPCVYIQTPQDYHIQTSDNIQVSAAVQTQSATSYGVLFVLDEGSSGEQQSWDNTPPFNASFVVPLPSEMEHRIDAYLTADSSQTPIGGANGNDFVESVGVGNYLVAMGDSTTDGIGDDDLIDISLDFRNGGGGYPPKLNDLLTAFYNGIPHTVVNEGVSGARSAGGVSIVNSLLAKHPDAQRFLLQYGINDAGAFPPVPSGLGLNPGDAGYTGSYKHNLQQMIDAINLAGREVCLAKIPIVLGDTASGTQYSDPENPPVGSRGDYVIEYNLVVDELVGTPANNITISPDLWTKFNEIVTGGQHRYELEYSDNFHMLGSGYDTTADEWKVAITN